MNGHGPRREPFVHEVSSVQISETAAKLRIRTVIVDPDSETIATLQSILNKDPEIELVGACHNGYDALSLILSTRPDLVFMDFTIPGMDGFSLLEHLRPG